MNHQIFERYEIKYIISEKEKQMLTEAMEDRIMSDTNGNFGGKSTVCNVYYDTPDFRLIRHSLERPLYKEKLRLRSYGTVKPDEKVFLELKKKYDGVVYKRRILLSQKDAVALVGNNGKIPCPTQIGNEVCYFLQFYENIRPTMYISYEREAFYSKEDSNLRITFDTNIQYRTTNLALTEFPEVDMEGLLEGQYLMEVKTSGALPLWLVELLGENHIYKKSFSKYGTAYKKLQQEKIKGDIQYA